MTLNLLSQIISDLKQPISYLPYGIITGTIYLLVIRIIKLLQKESLKAKKHDLVIAGFFVYMTVLWILAFFSREAGSRVGIDIEIFSVLGASTTETASYIENILLFIPISILFAMSYDLLKKPLYNIGLCFSFSVFLELMQLITSRGYCQIDDVIANTLGAVLGLVTYKLLNLTFNRESSVYIVKPLDSYGKLI